MNFSKKLYLIVLFVACGVLFNCCADYPNWKKHQWVINKKGYNVLDTIYVKDFILHLFEKTPFRDTLKVYENKIVFEDSIYNIVRNGLLKTGLNFNFIDNPKNKLESYFIHENRIKLRLIEEFVSWNVLDKIDKSGYKLLPIIEVNYKLDGFFTTQLIMTICIYNSENKLVYRKSRQRILDYDTEFAENDWSNIDYIIRTAIPIPYWEKLINEVLLEFKTK